MSYNIKKQAFDNRRAFIVLRESNQILRSRNNTYELEISLGIMQRNTEDN
jgi:hypothetical protein